MHGPFICQRPFFFKGAVGQISLRLLSIKTASCELPVRLSRSLTMLATALLSGQHLGLRNSILIPRGRKQRDPSCLLCVDMLWHVIVRLIAAVHKAVWCLLCGALYRLCHSWVMACDSRMCAGRSPAFVANAEYKQAKCLWIIEEICVEVSWLEGPTIQQVFLSSSTARMYCEWRLMTHCKPVMLFPSRLWVHY